MFASFSSYKSDLLLAVSADAFVQSAWHARGVPNTAKKCVAGNSAHTDSLRLLTYGMVFGWTVAT